MTFGEELKDARESRGIGRTKLGELTGLSLSYLHYIENDRVLPGPDNLKKIAKAINKASKQKVDAAEWIRTRDRIELERLGFDGNQADVTLLLRESGPLTDEAKKTIERTITRVLKDPRSRAPKQSRR